jgi:hypothetical protein
MPDNLTYKEKIMDDENWLVGWREIGKYIGKSAKTAQRYGKKELMPFLRDGGNRLIAKPSQIDKWIFGFNKRFYEKEIYKDKRINSALIYEANKEKTEKDFNQMFLTAQRPTRSRFLKNKKPVPKGNGLFC